jgi:hypothetical protein
MKNNRWMKVDINIINKRETSSNGCVLTSEPPMKSPRKEKRLLGRMI